MFRGNAPARIDFLSLDVEGSEIEVLKGAVQQVRKRIPVLTGVAECTTRLACRFAHGHATAPTGNSAPSAAAREFTTSSTSD